MNKILRFLFLIIIMIIIITFNLGIWKIFKLASSKILIQEDTIFTIKSGTGKFDLIRQLYIAKIIKQSRVFQWLILLNPKLFIFKFGTYRFTPGMSVYELFKLLISGREVQFPLCFIEGMRLSDYLNQLRQAPYIQHILKDNNYISVAKALNLKFPEQIEGWFWPDTWMYTAGTTDVSILKRAHTKMVTEVNKIWKYRSNNLPYKNKNQFLTVASIVEKETAIIYERSKVASVIINRLRIGMRLQTDPAVIYGMGNNYSGKISRKILITPNAYNTYIINGLPPSPIAIPSKSSLKAAAHPAKTNYLYFVANGKGGHIFSTNLVDHNKSVKKYLKLINKND